MWFLVLCIVLLLIACIPLGVNVRYNADGVYIRAVLSAVKIQVYPLPFWLRKKENKTSAKVDSKPENSKPKAEKTAEAKKSGGKLTDFIPLLKVGLSFLDGFRRKLRINKLELILTMAGDDPCDLAIHYGQANAAAETILSLLGSAFVICRQKVQILCDFLGEETKVSLDMEITITVGRLLSLAVYHGIRALKVFYSIKKNREKAV